MDLDRSPFITSLEAGRREGARFARESFKAALGADVRGLQQTLRSARSELGSYAQGDYKAKLGADPTDVTEGVRQAATRAEAFARQTYRAILGIDGSEVRTDVTAAEQLAERFARQTYEATVGVRGAARSAAELKAVDKAADSVDGRNVNVDVDRDGSGAAGVGTLTSGFRSLAGSIRATQTVLVAASIPFAIAAIGGAAPAVLSVSASLAGLALNLGRAATGFGLVAGAAGGGAAAGLLAYGRGIGFVVSQAAQLKTTLLEAKSAVVSANSAVKSAKEAVNDAKPGTRQYAQAQMELKVATEQLAEAQREYRRQQILNTPATREFGKEIQSMQMRLTRLQAAVGDQVLPHFTRELRAWDSILRDLTPSLADTAGNVAGIAAGFSKWFRTADDGKVLRDIVQFVSESATKGAATLAAAGQAGIMAFRPLIPLASKFQSNLLGVVRDTAKWVSSAEGQRKLGSIYRSLWADANRLWDILKDVGRAVFNVFDAIDESGIDNQAWRGLETLAGGLEDITSKGSEGRQKLNAFLNDAKRLMPSVGGAVVELASQFGRVVSKVIDFRQKGHKLTVLQEIFRGIKRSAGPMSDLLIDTFKDLGPEIAKLIPRMTEFLSNFAGSSGPLVTFTKSMNKALKIFNDLPEPVKKTAANAAALWLVLKPFGGDKIISGLAGIVGQYISMRLAVRRLNTTLGRTPPTVQTVPATGPSAIKRWAARLGILALALAPIVLATTIDWSGARKSVKEEIQQAGKDGKITADEYSDAMLSGIRTGLKGVPLLGTVSEFLFRNIIEPGEKRLGKWDPIDFWFRTRVMGKGPPKGMSGIGASLMEAVIAGMKGVPIFGPLFSQLDVLVGRGKRKAEEGKGIGKTFGQRIVNGLKSVPIIGPILQVFDALLGRSKRKVQGQQWKPIGLGAVGKMLDGFLTGGLITKTLGLIDRWFGRSKRKRESQSWKPLGSSAAADMLKGFLTGGLIGGAVGLIARWFSRSKRKSESQRWKPLGSGAVGDILKGMLGGGLIVGTLNLIDRWFNRSKRKREGQRWKPIGDSAAADILKGFVTGGLIGGALSLIDKWFSRSKRRGEGHRWKPIGDVAVGEILAGFLGGGLIGGAVKLVASWFSKSKNEADQHRWKPIGLGAAALILTGFKTGGLISGTVGLIASWFNRAKSKREEQNWKGIGLGAAFQAVTGFTGGGIVGVVADVLDRAAEKGKEQKGKFKKSGSDSARGFCQGFGVVDLGKCLVGHVKGAWDKVRKWGGEGSPWRRTMISGINAAKGFALGLLKDGGLAERNARVLASRVAKSIRDGVVDLGDVPKAVWDQLLKKGWIGDPRDNSERLYRPAASRGIQDPDVRSDIAAGAARPPSGTVLAEDGSVVPKSFYRSGRRVQEQIRDGIVSLGQVNKRTWDRLMRQGWQGDPRDSRERLYSPPRLRRRGMIQAEDGSWVTPDFYGRPRQRQSGLQRAEDGSLVPRGFYRDQDRVQKQIRDGVVDLGDVHQRTWDRLLKQGWRGDPRDNAERLYAPERTRPRDNRSTTQDERQRASQERLSDLMSRLASAVQRSDKEATLRLRKQIQLTQTAQELARVRRGARDAGPERRLEILRAQTEIARRLGRDQQVASLRKQIAQTERERRRQEARRAARGGQDERSQRQPRTGIGLGEVGAGATTRRRQQPAGITASEFRAALKEHTRDLAKLLRAGMADAPNLRAFQRQLDKSLGGYIGYRNGMGAQPQ